MIKNKLQIVLITYNRKNYLKDTLDNILNENSPIKDFDITILDNHSTDGTSEMIEQYCKNHPNLVHIINKINIGGNANITKAYADFLDKEYIWVLCDNDSYDFESWSEVENAINDGYDVIVTRNCGNNISELFHKLNFVPSGIYKTKNITSTTVINMYDNIYYLFPHLAIAAKNINNNKKFYIVKKDIVKLGVNPDYANTYIRGAEKSDIPMPRRMMYWSVGYINSIELITDRKKQVEIIDKLTHHHKNLFELFKSAIIYNKIYRNSYFYNMQSIFRLLSFKQKIKFIFAYLSIYLSCKNYKYWFIRYKEEWIEYLKEIKEQKYIDVLAKKYKNKKILLYGAGIFFEILSEDYDLSKLNIIGISDKKFEKTTDTTFKNYKIIKPDDIKNTDFDIILFTLKECNRIKDMFKKQGVNKKMYSIIKTDKKYAIKT